MQLTDEGFLRVDVICGINNMHNNKLFSFIHVGNFNEC